ncbi:GDSL-type esterase/lipase family protein [Flavivirga jejuensis]|uniref:GDSL-type esterase/lipase family protein n=1 Tax=Flavivirga jejuensis TaxID=870487 RepID=A0ABT8WJZ7_9FLAO|nr:GDSL-type esterase/lipase family protein [Flavivirga jejuensis]MDO5973483.1 GDSL-type esterase/lipase family protein [Flavivirga jejuensis]
MTSKKIVVTFLILVSTILNLRAQNITPDEKIVYKKINGDSLYLHVFKPQLSKKPTSVIVFFFGGGWVSGTPKQFYQQSEYFASRGMLAISAEYRVKNKHGASPFDCVEDAKSAIRWIREHAKELHIDPTKIVASGGSAGGHIAISTALIKGFENPNENVSVSSVPNAVVAYNPVLDTTEEGYGYKKVIGRETEISPCHQVKKEMPPMLIFHGKKDKIVPFENAKRFTDLMKEAGNECELVAIDNVGHGFFNGDFFRKGSGNKYYNLTAYQTDVFLETMCYLKKKPTLSQNIKHVSCVGDSNTEAKYPKFLQEKIGAKYQVKNFGKGGATLLDGTMQPYFKSGKYKNSLKFTPDIVLIMFGTNDANVKWCLDKTRKTEFAGTPQEEFKSQYIKLINTYKRKNEKAQIYILTPLPIYEHKKSRDPKIKQRIEQLNQWVIPVIREIAEEENIKLIDVNKLMQKGFKYTIDGVHLDQEGYKVLANKIAKEII